MAVEYASGSIHFSGLGSDTDFDTMITQLKTIESTYKNRLTLWQADWNRRIDAFQQLNTAMLSLSSTLNSMNTMNKFLLKTATSSNDSIMTATATADAQNNSNKIEVHKLATNAAYTWEGSRFASSKDKINPTSQTQHFVYTYKGKTVKLAVGANATMEQFINQINSDANNPGVRASLIKNGNEYVFQLQGQDTGASATLTIDATSSRELAIKPPAESSEFTTKFSSADAVINSSGAAQNFVYNYNGFDFTINVNDGGTLQDLAAAINSDPANPGVTAGVIQSGNMYSLQIKADDGTSTVQASSATQIQIAFSTKGDGASTGWNTTSYNIERTSSDLRFDKASRSINSSGADQNFIWTDSTGGHTLSVAAGTTLSQLAAQINAAGSSTRAEVCKDNNGYYLQLTELNPNADAAPQIDPASSGYLAITGDNTYASSYSAVTESYTQHSQGFASPDSRINYSGSDQAFKYTYAGKTYSVQVADGASLQDLADAINSNSEIYSDSTEINSKVRARIACDGNDTYRLYLYSTTGNTTEKIAIASGSSAALEIAPPRASWTGSGNNITYARTFDSAAHVINTAATAQDFKFIDGSGNLQTVSVAAGASLQSLIDSINANTAAHGVTASTVDVDGNVQLKLSGSTGPVHVESTSSRLLEVSSGLNWSTNNSTHSISFGNFADANAVINNSGTAQDFIFVYRNKDYKISLNDGASLQDLVDAINNDPGMSALVRADAVVNGSSTQFVLKSNEASGQATPTIADSSSSALAICRNTLSSYVNKEKNTVSDVITANGEIINWSGQDQTFTYTYNGTSGSITVPDGCSMGQFIELINGNNNMKDVYASAEFVGVDGSGNKQYKLHLSGSNPNKAPTVSAASSKHDAFAIRPPLSEFSQDNDVPVSVYELALNGSDVVNATTQDQKFMVEYMGKNISLTIQPGETVDDLINKLNSQNDAQIKANLFTAQDGKQYLQLWGTDPAGNRPPQVCTTSSPELLITPPKIDSGGWYVQLNSNAQLKLNDWPEGDKWIESESNAPTELVEGVNLNLKDVGVAQLTVTTNNSGIKEQVVAFVDALNSVRALINQLTAVDTGKNTGEIGETASNFDAQMGSILTGNYGVQLLSSILKSTTASQAQGFQYQTTGADGVISGDLYSSLAQIGITTCADTNDPNLGLLVIDEEKLDAALARDAQAVAELFAADNKASVDTSDFIFGGYISGQTQPGVYEFHYTINTDDNIIDPYVICGGKKYKANWDSNANEITIMEGPGKGLSIQVNNAQQGSYTGKVTLKMGKVGELSALVSELNNSDGILNILKTNYQQISKNIQSKIDKEEERLIVWERTMRDKFARLEATLSQYNSLQAQLNSTIKQLDSGTKS